MEQRGLDMFQTSIHSLFCDSFFILHGRLMFASLHGREANVLGLLAELTQSNHNRSFQSLGFYQDGDKSQHPLERTANQFVGLSKKVAKYMSNDYGQLTHVFLYVNDLLTINLELKTAWLMLLPDETDTDKLIWNLVEKLIDEPLLRSWKPHILKYLSENDGLFEYQNSFNSEFAIFGIIAIHVMIPPDFTAWLSQSIKSGFLNPT